MTENANTLYARADDVFETEVNGAVVLLHLGNWNYFEFNPVSTAIWSLLETPADLGTLVDDLGRQFDVDREQCLRDTRQFLDEMIAEGVLTRT